MSELIERAIKLMNNVTLGPWTEGDDDNGDWWVKTPDESHNIFMGNLEDTCQECHANSTFIAASRELVPELVAALMKLEDSQQWISVTEKPPEEGEDVLISVNYTQARVAFLVKDDDDENSSYFRIWSGGAIYLKGNHIVWMQMPKPLEPPEGFVMSYS